MNAQHILLSISISAFGAASASAQVPSVRVRIGAQLPGAPVGQLVTSIGAVATTPMDGWALAIDTNGPGGARSHIYGAPNGGAPALLRTEQLIGNLQQDEFRTRIGANSFGGSAYTAVCTDTGSATANLDCIFVDDTPIAIEQQPIVSLAGKRFRSNDRVHLFTNGAIAWLGGIEDSSSGFSEGFGLFVGAGATVLAKSGDAAPAPLMAQLDANLMDAGFDFSPDGAHWIATLHTNGATSADRWVTIDGALVNVSGGGLLGEGELVPVAAGGDGSEAWQNFSAQMINDAGDYVQLGDTSGPSGSDGFLLKNGVILVREGQTLDSLPLIGQPNNVALNSSAQVAFAWVTSATFTTALFVDGRVVAQVGDGVDLNGDGLADAGVTIGDLNGGFGLALTDRGTLYFAATVSDHGNAYTALLTIAGTTGPRAFCFGDGLDVSHTSTCPCANNGAAGHGCANSVQAGGALLGSSGQPVFDDVVLHASSMPVSAVCIYLQGNAIGDAVFGDGVACTAGTILRLRAVLNSGGASSFPNSSETITLSARGGVTPGSGVQRFYQTYYRNAAAAYCPPATFNVTNGLVIDW